MPGDLIDKERDQRFGQKVAHPGDNAQARAGDVGGGVLPSGQRWRDALMGRTQRLADVTMPRVPLQRFILVVGDLGLLLAVLETPQRHGLGHFLAFAHDHDVD